LTGSVINAILGAVGGLAVLYALAMLVCGWQGALLANRRASAEIASLRTQQEEALAHAPRLSFGRAILNRHPETITLTDGGRVGQPGRIIRVPISNEQGAETARSVQATITFLPDDKEGSFSPRHPAIGEWHTDQPATVIDIPGNGQPHLLDVALHLNAGHPCVFEWTRQSRSENLRGFGVASYPVEVLIEVKGSASNGSPPPSVTETLRIEATGSILRADWLKDFQNNETTNWVPKT
jgi:hypothetical protein